MSDNPNYLPGDGSNVSNCTKCGMRGRTDQAAILDTTKPVIHVEDGRSKTVPEETNNTAGRVFEAKRGDFGPYDTCPKCGSSMQVVRLQANDGSGWIYKYYCPNCKNVIKIDESDTGYSTKDDPRTIATLINNSKNAGVPDTAITDTLSSHGVKPEVVDRALKVLSPLRSIEFKSLPRSIIKEYRYRVYATDDDGVQRLQLSTDDKTLADNHVKNSKSKDAHVVDTSTEKRDEYDGEVYTYTKAEMGYVDVPPTGPRCGKCAWFQSPNRCGLVKDPKSPDINGEYGCCNAFIGEEKAKEMLKLIEFDGGANDLLQASRLWSESSQEQRKQWLNQTKYGGVGLDLLEFNEIRLDVRGQLVPVILGKKEDTKDSEIQSTEKEEGGPWDGYQKDSPMQLLDRFSKRFPDSTEEDIKKFAKSVGIGDTVVKQYLGEARPVKRDKYLDCSQCGQKILAGSLSDHEKKEHGYDSSKDPNYVRYPETGFPDSSEARGEEDPEGILKDEILNKKQMATLPGTHPSITDQHQSDAMKLEKHLASMQNTEEFQKFVNLEMKKIMEQVAVEAMMPRTIVGLMAGKIIFGAEAGDVGPLPIHGILAYAGVSHNRRLYLPEQLARGHGVRLPLIFNHATPMGIDREMMGLPPDIRKRIQNHERIVLGHVVLDWKPEELTLFYRGEVDHPFFKNEIREGRMSVSLGMLFEDSADPVCDVHCYTVVKSGIFQEVSLVYHPGFPVASINITEAFLQKQALEVMRGTEDDSDIEQCPKCGKDFHKSILSESPLDVHMKLKHSTEYKINWESLVMEEISGPPANTIPLGNLDKIKFPSHEEIGGAPPQSYMPNMQTIPPDPEDVEKKIQSLKNMKFGSGDTKSDF